MSAISNWLPTPPDNFSTTLSSGIANDALSIPLSSVSGLPTEGVGQLFKKDANGDVVAGSIEYVHWTNISGSSLTLTNAGDRGLTGSDSSAQAYSAGDYFEVWVSSYYYDSQRDGFDVEHATDGTHDATIVAMLGGTQTFTGTKTLTTPVINGAVTGTITPPKTFYGTNFIPERGGLLNGLISPTVSSNNLTVAIKGVDGNDPSATNPVYIRIGNNVRAITAALSVTKNAGTNWCNAGSAELATKEIDYFVYLGYNATDGVVIGFSRIPSANSYDDFSTTSTNEKYAAISTITNAAATDYYENIGRFAATLSAGAGYTWTVPTYTAKNLIQRPIYETRWIDWVPSLSVSGGTAPTYTANYINRYKIKGDNALLNSVWLNSSGGTAGNGAAAIVSTLPISMSSNIYVQYTTTLGNGAYYENEGTYGALFYLRATGTNSIDFLHSESTIYVSVIGNDQSNAARSMRFNGLYEI